ncbi:molybdopterin-dependent oxidoreductase [Nocardioides dongxiaopingii]|uniref:molybdopterin-dependent oxidoreductase n=1 Tax=Nocardioides sp. S-1144 TaxID=2582905 RepID=UPI001C9E6091|nr:molybdopterin-dependent oxidoreductase [Nocardioides sp. S-1144]
MLLVVLPVVTVTGLLSYAAYGPRFDQAYPGDVGFLRLPDFDWPTDPPWLYRLNQGLHVGLGLVVVPVVLAKLWSVIPKLFQWPPARSLAQVLERVSLLMLVGGLLFEIVTGVLNIQYDYVFGFSFYTAHYYGAWVFIAGFVVHVPLKLPTMVRALRGTSLREVMRTGREDTRPETGPGHGLIPADPDPPTLSRRGALGLVGGGSLLVLVLTAGQTVGGVARYAAVLMPRGRQPAGTFPVNKTAEAAGISREAVAGWRLTLTGGAAEVSLTREQLLALPQHTATLPIACVEGWSTTQTWTGVRLRDLARLAGVTDPSSARVDSIQESGLFRAASLQANQVAHADSMLALQVDGADLTLDHGYPARIMVPAIPGVHCTKWVGTIDFEAG